MFQKRRSSAFKRAVERSADPELRDLNGQLSERQERVAQLELELFDTRSNLARFEREVDQRLGPLRERLRDLQDELTRARRTAARRAQWGDRADESEIPDVVDQFRRAWTRVGSSEPAADPAPRREDQEADLKALFRGLAKRFHPDLVTDPGEKRWREGIMAQVNEAYRKRDLAALRELAETPDRVGASSGVSREEELVRLKKEIRRLDGVIAALESALQQLINSAAVRLMLDASIARREGRDLVGELAADLRAQIAEVEVELGEYR